MKNTIQKFKVQISIDQTKTQIDIEMMSLGHLLFRVLLKKYECDAVESFYRSVQTRFLFPRAYCTYYVPFLHILHK